MKAGVPLWRACFLLEKRVSLPEGDGADPIQRIFGGTVRACDGAPQ